MAKLNTRENSVGLFAWEISVEHWEDTELKCSKISTFQKLCN